MSQADQGEGSPAVFKGLTVEHGGNKLIPLNNSTLFQCASLLLISSPVNVKRWWVFFNCGHKSVGWAWKGFIGQWETGSVDVEHNARLRLVAPLEIEWPCEGQQPSQSKPRLFHNNARMASYQSPHYIWDFSPWIWQKWRSMSPHK